MNTQEIPPLSPKRASNEEKNQESSLLSGPENSREDTTHTPLFEIESEDRNPSSSHLIAGSDFSGEKIKPDSPSISIHEEVTKNGIRLLRASQSLSTIRVLFGITTLLYMSMRMMVVSGIIGPNWARYSAYLEPIVFLLSVLYIASWITKVSVDASPRFEFIRYILWGIGGIGALGYTIWWGNFF